MNLIQKKEPRNNFLGLRPIFKERRYDAEYVDRFFEELDILQGAD